TCADGDHPVCTDCVAQCAVCERAVCDSHASVTSEGASRGARRLCGECVARCEGGANELVGRDEATQCATCAKQVCETHGGTCDVDQRLHCSSHLRRTLRSHRLVCEQHQE